MTAATLWAAVALAAQTEAVEFRFAPEGPAKSVHVAGSFNSWSTTASPMQAGANGVWTLRLELPYGKHWYKFVVDGSKWFTDPATKAEDDGNGNMNSVLVVLPPGYEKPAKRGDGVTTWLAVRHRTDAPARNFDRGSLRLTVVARAGDVDSVHVRFDGESYALRLAGGDELEERYVVDVPWDGKSDAKYSFTVRDGDRGAWITPDGAVIQTNVEPDARRHFRIGPADVARMPRPPEWVEDSVFYQIFPDRFENGDASNDPPGTQPWDAEPTWFNWFGGDLAGVGRRLGHLEALGVSAVYFNPVFQGPSNHRYETSDYERVDARLGTNEQFASLVREMRRRGMRTVLDGVFNHTAVDFKPFADLLARQQHSPYASWYEVATFPVEVRDNPPYKAWFGFPSMPELDFRNPDVRDMVLKVVDFWEREAGVDGWRLDVANEVPDSFWREFRRRLKRHSRDRWICGEIWGDASQWLKGDQFDSVMNYRFREAVLGLVARRRLKPSEFLDRLMDVHEGYGPQTSRNMLNLLGSHDTPRILTECGGDARRAQFAAQLQFAWVGAPCVYYGDELGMAGGRDPENRRGMAWATVGDGNESLQLYRRVSKARRGSAALRRGGPEPLPALDEAGVFAFRRVYGSERVLVVANSSDTERSYPVSSVEWGGALPASLVDLYAGGRYSAAQGKLHVRIPALSVIVLAPGQAQSSPALRAHDPGRSRPKHL